MIPADKTNDKPKRRPPVSSLFTERPITPKIAKCSVCSSNCPANPPGSESDQLCWVCRRLKISAWRDSDVQMPAQE